MGLELTGHTATARRYPVAGGVARRVNRARLARAGPAGIAFATVGVRCAFPQPFPRSLLAARLRSPSAPITPRPARESLPEPSSLP